jgi:hypothetical protein
MGEKAATNEVITKLVSALGDQSENVRRNACSALRNMGEKAATNEVISKLLVVILAPKIVVDLCLCKYASSFLQNISENELINVFLSTENFEWLPAVTLLTLLKEVAVTVRENKVVLYGKTEPLSLIFQNSELCQPFAQAFADQRERLQLSL